MAPTKKSTSSTSTASPESLALSSSRSNCHFSVGRCLGTGAQAAVHAVLDDKTGNETDFAVKVAPLPKTWAAPKKKQSLEEINANSLNGEFAAYQAYKPLQGSMIPTIPPYTDPGVPVKGEIVVHGTPKYRYLVMEKMDLPLMACVDSFVSSDLTSVSVGLLLTRLIDIIEAIHRYAHIVIDVKVDNIMLAKNASSSSPEATAEALATRIRFIDLASLRMFRDIVSGKHQPNQGGRQLEGTPLYSSLHVHQGQSPSRRDDVFAAGLVFAELLIRLQAAITGTTQSFEHKTKFPSYLPWANEPSVEAVGNCKEKQVLDHRSAFYQRMPKGAAKVMFDFFAQAHSIEYAQKPEYDDFRALVRRINVALPRTAEASKSTSRLARNKKKSLVQQPAANLKSPPVSSPALHPTPSVPASGIQINVVKGSFQGQRFVLTKDTAESLSIGSGKLTASELHMHDDHVKALLTFGQTKGRSFFVHVKNLGSDNSIVVNEQGVPRNKTTQVLVGGTIELPGSATVLQVGKWDGSLVGLNSTSTIASNDLAPSSSSTGRVTRQTKRSQEASYLQENDESPAKLAKIGHDDDEEDMAIDDSFCTAHTSPSDDEPEPMDVDVEPIAGGTQDKKSPKKSIVRGLELQVIEGPQQGETFILIEGVNEVLVFGANSRSRTGEARVAFPDERFAATYAKLSLVVTTGGGRSVKVQDLGGNTTHVKDSLVPVNKTAHAFPHDSIRLGMTAIRVLPFDGQRPMVEPADGVVQDKKPPAKRIVRGLKLQVAEGPLQGQTFILAKEGNEALVVGKNPSSRSDETLAIPDACLAETHAKLSLVVTKAGSRYVKVEGLCGSNTRVNDNLVPAKKTAQAFPNDSIRLGSTVIHVVSFDGPTPILEKENVSR